MAGEGVIYIVPCQANGEEVVILNADDTSRISLVQSIPGTHAL